MDTSTHQLSDGQLTWIEGIGNTEQQQQQQQEEAKAKHFDIARKFKLKHGHCSQTPKMCLRGFARSTAGSLSILA
jgi:hypothetical protein